MTQELAARMREDWNARAAEDANYYVAFGRRQQNEAEFFNTGARVAESVFWETRRLDPAVPPRSRRALEIGCGPGRLMKPLSAHFGEIHGVDVSDEMIRLARERLRDVPHAHVHANDGSELPQFASESFDLVYSYAVFQHIPSRDVVIQYLRETHRVLKPDGIARLQFNGLPQTVPQYDTWSGVRFTPRELIGFTREHDLQILALEGVSSQYLWTTWRKRQANWRDRLGELSSAAEDSALVRRVTSGHSSEPVAPNRGPLASISIWIERLPAEVDLFDLDIRAGGIPVTATYIGPPDASGLQQINAVLQESDISGLVPVELKWCGRRLCEPAILRMIPAGPHAPRIVSVSDGVNLMSGHRIETGCVKVSLEEVAHPDRFHATIDGRDVIGMEIFCTDPLPRRYEVNFRLPEDTRTGSRVLELSLGRRRFAPIMIEVTGA